MIIFDETKEVGGIRGWNWVKTDFGAWEGPKEDWEKHHLPNINKYVTSFDTVIQAGGNQGMYPKLLAEMFQHVITMEPDYLNFRVLNLNCVSPNIIKYQCALGDTNGLCDISRPTMNNTGMHSTTLNDESGAVPIHRLDTLLLSSIPKKLDLLMFDLEGNELAALTGAKGIINKHRPVIFVERPTREVYTLLADKHSYRKVDNSAMDVIFMPY